ncbi:hypothetical protein Ocin01_16443 [Orchesella cincta]|uniref:Uncharacterized protein n=1 Tax=Orchesella cincta TaxID=48709 RepID=A0A1D2MB67_ORCCI|nr:hypothetical protein Ocin01_16443 [Orchesella cincta]
MDSSSRSFRTLIKFLVVASAFHAVISVQLEDIAEICSGNFITMDYNATWEQVDPVTNYFIPLASKYFGYHVAQNMYKTQEFNYLTQDHLENGCLSVSKAERRAGWELMTVDGFGGKNFTIRMVRTEIPKLFRFHFPYPNEGLTGYASIALSDNQSYNVFDFCFDNGLRSFAVVTTTGPLSAIHLEVVKAHLKALGFKEEHFLYARTSDCEIETEPSPAPPSIKYPKYFIATNILHPTFFWSKKK